MLPKLTLTIPMYGLMMLLGILAGFFLLLWTRKSARWTEDDIFYTVLSAIVFGFLGAKLLYWIVEFNSFIQDPMRYIASFGSGFVFYGALIGGVFGIWLSCHIRKLSTVRFLDAVAPSVAIAQAIGRVGCFFAGCCYGKETGSFLGISFPAPTDGSQAVCPVGVPLVPTQLMEAAFCLLLTVFLLWIFKRRNRFAGYTLGWYLLLYGAWRFVIEFFRGDEIRGFIGPLSTSQFVSIFMVIGGVLLLLNLQKKWIKPEIAPESEGFAEAPDAAEAGVEEAEAEPETAEVPGEEAQAEAVLAEEPQAEEALAEEAQTAEKAVTEEAQAEPKTEEISADEPAADKS